MLEQADQTALEALYKPSTNHTLRQRCQVGLLKAAGRPSLEVAAVVGLCQARVDSWIKCYRQEGLNGLYTKPERGRKSRLMVHADEPAIRQAVTENRQRISLAKAEWESQRAAGEPPVGRDTFRAFLNVLVAAISASDGA